MRGVWIQNLYEIYKYMKDVYLKWHFDVKRAKQQLKSDVIDAGWEVFNVMQKPQGTERKVLTIISTTGPN